MRYFPSHQKVPGPQNLPITTSSPPKKHECVLCCYSILTFNHVPNWWAESISFLFPRARRKKINNLALLLPVSFHPCPAAALCNKVFLQQRARPVVFYCILRTRLKGLCTILVSQRCNAKCWWWSQQEIVTENVTFQWALGRFRWKNLRIAAKEKFIIVLCVEALASPEGIKKWSGAYCPINNQLFWHTRDLVGNLKEFTKKYSLPHSSAWLNRLYARSLRRTSKQLLEYLANLRWRRRLLCSDLTQLIIKHSEFRYAAPSPSRIAQWKWVVVLERVSFLLLLWMLKEKKVNRFMFLFLCVTFFFWLKLEDIFVSFLKFFLFDLDLIVCFVLRHINNWILDTFCTYAFVHFHKNIKYWIIGTSRELHNILISILSINLYL